MKKPDLISFSEFLMLAPFYDQRQFFAPEIEHMKNGLDALLTSGLIQEEKNPLIEYYDKVAVLKIDGPMRPGRDWYFSVGYGDIQDAIDELMDSNAETVIQYMETPGGTVTQAFETEDKFYELAKKKRLVSAIAMATSAGALLTFPAQERWLLGKTAMTGSIGVVGEHIDARIWYKDFLGEVRTSVAKGEYKDAGTDTRGYDAKAKLIFEEQISKFHSIFVESAAKGLKKTFEEIDAQQSKVYIGQDGIDAGFAQGFSTLSQLIEKYNTSTTFFSTPVQRPAFQNIQTEVTRMDKNQLKAEHPDVYQAIATEAGNEREAAVKQTYIDQGKALGAMEERTRMNEIDALSFPADFSAKAKTEGWQPAEAALNYQKLDAENRKKIQAGMESDLEQPLKNNAPKPPEVPKAQTENENPVEAFNTAVAKLEAEGKTKGEAQKLVKNANPELHQKWLNAINQGGK